MKSKLLAKYLAKECSSEEYAAVQQWLTKSKENEERMKDFADIWNLSKEYPETMEDFDVELDWAVLQSRIESESKDRPKKVTPSKNILSLNSNWAVFSRVAAIFLMAAFIGVCANKINFQESPVVESILKEISMDKGQKGSLTLSDGTKVLINSDSKITLPNVFKADVREVYLEGEAYFDVAENPDKPFIIYTRGTVVQVLGTSFSIRAFPEEETIQTVVEEGVVSFREEKQPVDEGVILTAGKLGRFNLDKKDMVTENVEDMDLYLSWKDGYLKFQKASMKEVRRQLERKYDIKVDFHSEEIGQLQLTAELKSRSLNNVLETISMSLGLQYKLDQDTVSFSKVEK
ncbi:MAG: FecR domain-containing protein [Balneolaceae bacterium]